MSRLATVATTGGGRVDVPNPRHLGRKLRKLRRLEREKARRAKGGANRAKTRREVAVQHGKVARARRDYHHKQALTLVRDNQAVYVEDLNVAGMVRNRRLARAISDAGFGQLVRLLEEKAERYGRTVHKIDRWFPSSKTCSTCGRVADEMPLAVREWTCPCGAVHDRDHNAARNILAAGRADRLNASHLGGRDAQRPGGAGVRPPLGVAVGVEAGTTPDAA